MSRSSQEIFEEIVAKSKQGHQFHELEGLWLDYSVALCNERIDWNKVIKNE